MAFTIDCIIVSRVGCVFAVLAVVQELAHLNLCNQRGHAAYVVVVKMRNQHMIDALDAGIFHGGQYALCVAAVVAGPASVDQQRLARWRDQQRGLAAFYIDGIDEQMAGAALRRERLAEAEIENITNAQAAKRETKRAIKRNERDDGRIE